MSTCGSCPLYGAQNSENKLLQRLACNGTEQQDCADRLQEVIFDISRQLRETRHQLNDVKWQWNEIQEGLWVSRHEWAKDICWYIQRVKIERKHPTATSPYRITYECGYVRIDNNAITSGNIWSNMIKLHTTSDFKFATEWIYENYNKYPEKLGDQNETIKGYIE